MSSWGGQWRGAPEPTLSGVGIEPNPQLHGCLVGLAVDKVIVNPVTGRDLLLVGESAFSIEFATGADGYATASELNMNCDNE